MYLADTNILSEATKPAPDRRIVEWLESHEELIRVSAVTIGEIHYGIELLADGRKKADLRKWLLGLRNTFASSVLPVDDQVALSWAVLRASLDRRGRKIPVVDSLLAATALQHNLTLVTANTGDFITSGAKLLDPRAV
jgi:predicted nucleic acid-binding protein